VKSAEESPAPLLDDTRACDLPPNGPRGTAPPNAPPLLIVALE
jgi:hypothetical protein